MEGIIQNAAGADLAAVLKKLGAMALNEIKKVPGLPENIEWLKEEVDIIRAVLRDLSDDENPSAQMKLWRNKQIELMYDMEDAIDRFFFTRENRNKDKDWDSDDDDFDIEDRLRYTPEFVESTMKTIQSCIESMKNLPRKYRIANEIENLKDRSKKFESQPKKSKKSDTCETSDKKADLKRQNAINELRANLVAVDERGAQIINMLDFNSPEAQHKVVFIVGGGGFGKTTLAGHVLNTVRRGAQFQCRASVFVTRKPDIKNIFIDILLGFDYKETSSNELQSYNKEHLSHLLKEYVKNKRYFLVVDDIWDACPWDAIKSALFDSSIGGRILVTTRKRDVATACCYMINGSIYDIKPLSDRDAEDLLLKVFPDRICPPVLKEPFDKILKKCDGLPLAITTLSRLLVDKVTPGQWDKVYDSLNRADAHTDVDVMRRIFSLSYFGLPQHLRPCLLYFSIFPEGKTIKRKRLISTWAAEGFIRVQDGKDVMEKGKCYFDDLIKSSLIQPAKIKYDGEARACRVHDIIHHYITIKSVDEDNFVALQLGDNIYRRSEESIKCRRLCVHNTNGDHYIRLGYDLHHVRSLTVFGKFDDTPGCLVGDSALRVLDLEDATIQSHHPISVTEHLQLKYLSLTRNAENEAPDGIDHLKYLETLHFGGDVHIGKLPSSISNLRRLVRLFVDSYVELPDSVAGLVSLEELKGFNVQEQSIEFLQNLCHLEKLRVLRMHWNCSCYGDSERRKVAEKEMLLITSIRKLLGKHLQSISVDVGLENHVNPSIDQWFGYGTNCAKLLKFCTTRLWVSRVPSWLSSELVKNMHKLRLGISKMQQLDLDILGTLHSLLYLFLDHDWFDNKKDRLVISRNGFESLRYFCVKAYSMRYLFHVESMPKLQHLELMFLPSHCDQFDFGIDNLSHVKMIDVTMVYQFDNPEDKQQALQAETAINTAANNLGNSSTIKINKEDGDGWM